MESQPPPPEILPSTQQEAPSKSATTPPHNPHTSHAARRTRHALLLQTTSSFCNSLMTTPPSTLLTQYFTPLRPQITEHGPEWSRSLLPFLSKTFTGSDECQEYFRLLGEILDMKIAPDGFPGTGDGARGWNVDISSEPSELEVESKLNSSGAGGSLPGSPVLKTFPRSALVRSGSEADEGWEGKGIVTVVGKGVFVAKGTGREWSEKFIYRFSGFDGEGRIGHWEIWADPLSAWVAVGGVGQDGALGLK